MRLLKFIFATTLATMLVTLATSAPVPELIRRDAPSTAPATARPLSAGLQDAQNVLGSGEGKQNAANARAFWQKLDAANSKNPTGKRNFTIKKKDAPGASVAPAVNSVANDAAPVLAPSTDAAPIVAPSADSAPVIAPSNAGALPTLPESGTTAPAVVGESTIPKSVQPAAQIEASGDTAPAAAATAIAGSTTPSSTIPAAPIPGSNAPGFSASGSTAPAASLPGSTTDSALPFGDIESSDAAGRKKQVEKLPNGGTKETTFDAAGKVQTITLIGKNGGRQITKFDAAGKKSVISIGADGRKKVDGKTVTPRGGKK